MQRTHEENVEAFYSHGSATRGTQENGFLSFGYWTDRDMDYQQAGEALIARVLQSEKALDSGSVLNVACGYGVESLRIFEKLRPDFLIGIDVTAPHIEFARARIHALHLEDHIRFEKIDACKVTYQPQSFDYVIGIEGPAHFNTRECFLRKAFELLKPGGVLLLSDIVVDDTVVAASPYNHFLGSFCAKHWYMPKANWMSIAGLQGLLESIGYKVDYVEGIGEHVYPGFARYNLKWDSLINAINVRGLRIGVALTFISWLLGYVFRRRMIDYVILRATKG